MAGGHRHHHVLVYLVALGLLMLADRGQLDYDAAVARYWPEFAQGGKEKITVRQLMNHCSGLSAVDAPLTLDSLGDSAQVSTALEQQVPLWAPGSAQGYGAVSLGLYGKELFSRIAGCSLGTFLAREVCGPLGADMFLGLPSELDHRVAKLYPSSTRVRLTKVLPIMIKNKGVEGRIYRAFLRSSSATHRAFANPQALGLRGLQNFNLTAVHRMELPWCNGIGNARGLSRIYSALAAGGTIDGVTLCQPESLTPVHDRQSFVECDRVLLKPLGFSQGFVKEELHLFSPHVESFGHPGAGGSVGFADPKMKLGFSYASNAMDYHLRSPRALALCHSVYNALGVEVPHSHG